jgi:N-acyl-D-aspartate/D-glutamate deacylase
LGLQDRGYIKEGMWADITVFDPVNIHTTSLWGPVEKVRRHPKGMPYVLVNGVLVKDEDKMTGALPGKVLFHEA